MIALVEALSLGIAVTAIVLSMATTWLTLLRRRNIRMTQPTVIFFGPDGGRPPERPPMPKIYIRTLLFSTAKRGRVLESLYAVLLGGSTRCSFRIWVHGDEGLVRGR